MNGPSHDTFEVARAELMEAAGMVGFYSDRVANYASIGDVEEAACQMRNLVASVARSSLELQAMAAARVLAREIAAPERRGAA